MGMLITVRPPRAVGDVAVFDTDRSITGQDGSGFPDAAAAASGDTAAARLAQRLFGSDPAVEHVFVASSQVVVRRRGGWGGAAEEAAAAVIAGFFVHYS